MRKRLFLVVGIALALPASCLQAQLEPSWLETYLKTHRRWKVSETIEKNKYGKTDVAECGSSELRDPQSPEEMEVAQKGYFFIKRAKSPESEPGGLKVVIASLDSGRQCGWEEQQGFIFLDYKFISTLAPDVMVTDADGGFIEARVKSARDFEVDFEDFSGDYKGCSATAHSPCGYVTINFHVKEAAAAQTSTVKYTVQPISFRHTAYPRYKTPGDGAAPGPPVDEN
jgi:hypothetical protein